jgi:hypothetical protein
MTETKHFQKSRKTVVEMHPKRLKIEKELAEGLPIRAIAKKYHISRQALEGYKRNRLPSKLVKAIERRDITDAQQLFQVILKAVQRMEKLSDACDSFLQDPDNPGEYYMGPRAHDLKIVYLEGEKVVNKRGEKIVWKKKTAMLQDLLNVVNGVSMWHVVSVQSADADPRMLLVKSSEALTKSMETLVNAWRSIDQGKNTFLGTPAWNEVVGVILKATEEHPGIRRAIADGLNAIAGK